MCLPIVAVLPHGWLHLLQDSLKEQELLYLPIVAVLPHGWLHLLQDSLKEQELLVLSPKSFLRDVIAKSCSKNRVYTIKLYKSEIYKQV